MASPSLIPAGDYRTTYASDTTIFPTRTSRNAAIIGLALVCCAPLVFTLALTLMLTTAGPYVRTSEAKSGRPLRIGTGDGAGGAECASAAVIVCSAWGAVEYR